MTHPLSLGFSPCPNDTFMFHALAEGDVEVPGFTIMPWLADIEALNTRALGNDPMAVTKVSVHGYAYLADRYQPLRVGAVLGRGCGPLVVARTPGTLASLGRRRVAIPGRYTTASLLLRLFAPDTIEVVPMRFERIMPAVAEREVDAGVIIHESRFTYANHGLIEVANLGAVWEAETQLPLPLAMMVLRRVASMPPADLLEDRLRASILAARTRPDASAAYVQRHAQEMDPDVCRRHIELYVNDYCLALGQEGEAAIGELLARGASAGILPLVGGPRAI